MLKVVWDNRDNWEYAWEVLRKGVCDGCALGVAGFHDWTIEGTHLCMTRLNLLRLNTMGPMDHEVLKDAEALRHKSNIELRDLGRLAHPMLRERGDRGFRRISWEEAYGRIAAKIRETDPERLALFVTSRGVTNEVYYVAQKVARFLGSNNVDNAARICHSPSTAAMKRTLGVAASTCGYRDWYGTDLVIFFGSNPANDQPVTTKYLHQAKALGTKVVMVNPYLEPGMKQYWVPSEVSSALFGTELTDYWFPVSQGGDIAFLCAVIKILIANNWYSQSFLDENVEGFTELKEAVEALDADHLAELSGLSAGNIRHFAELIRDAESAVLVWSMGITQHSFGTDAVQMILNLGLLQGWVGRDKTGLMPIRGHSSVQGGAEMGAYATAFPGGKIINEENARSLGEEYGFEIPTGIGLKTTEMVEAAHRGELDLLYCLGGNFLRNLPNEAHVEEGLRRVPLRVHQDIIVTDQMCIPAAEAVLLLPAKTRYEQDGGGIETTTERRIAFSPELSRQVGEAKAEWKILRELASEAYPDRAHLLGCETGRTIREEIARVVPFYDGIQDLEDTGDAIQYGGPHLCADGQFPTPDGKAHLFAVEVPEIKPRKGRFLLSTRRGKQFNSLIYAEIDPINGASRDSILMNEADAEDHFLKHGDAIRLVNECGTYDGRVFHAPIARGNLQAHWPEANIIIPEGTIDHGGGVPDYNAVVTIEKIG